MRRAGHGRATCRGRRGYLGMRRPARVARCRKLSAGASRVRAAASPPACRLKPSCHELSRAVHSQASAPAHDTSFSTRSDDVGAPCCRNDEIKPNAARRRNRAAFWAAPSRAGAATSAAECARQHGLATSDHQLQMPLTGGVTARPQSRFIIHIAQAAGVLSLKTTCRFRRIASNKRADWRTGHCRPRRCRRHSKIGRFSALTA